MNDQNEPAVLRERIGSLENLTKQRFVSHEREHQLIREAMEEFKDTLSARLESMNEFRDQIGRERSDFLRKEVYDKYHDALLGRVALVEKTQWMIAGGIVVLGTAMQIALHFIGK